MPEQKLIISYNVDSEDNLQEENIEKLKTANAFCKNYSKYISDFNDKLINQKNSYLSEIKKLKEKLEQKKEALFTAKKEYDDYTSNNLDNLNKKYKEISTNYNNLKSQPIFNDVFYQIPSQGDFPNLKFSRKEVYDQEYIFRQLQIDLLDFKDYVISKNDKKSKESDTLIALITKLVNESLGYNYEIKIYGSHATGLCLPSSDIDIVIANKRKSMENCFVCPLDRLNNSIIEENKKRKLFSEIKYISNTAVPLIKIQTSDLFAYINLDITLEDPNHYGVKCVDYIKEKINEYEILLPLALAVKNILFKAGLNEAYKGGLSSYGVVLLIIYYLQVDQSVGVDISLKNLGNVFYGFLYYYGKTLDPKTHIINVRGYNPNDYSFYIPQLQMDNDLGIVIIDPLNPQNNVGKNARQYPKIKCLFWISYLTARESCECGCHFQYGEFCLKEEKIEHCILKRIFNVASKSKDIIRNLLGINEMEFGY